MFQLIYKIEKIRKQKFNNNLKNQLGGLSYKTVEFIFQRLSKSSFIVLETHKFMSDNLPQKPSKPAINWDILKLKIMFSGDL